MRCLVGRDVLGFLIVPFYWECGKVYNSLGSFVWMDKIGLLGPLGTFTEEAAIEYCDGSDCEMVPYGTISDVFRAVESGEVSEGVVPIENFLNGHVMETLDNLNKTGLKIQTALVLPIRHCLAVGADVGNIEIVKSHPQALAQCSNYLDANYSDAVRADAPSTASAMKEIAEEKFGNVAVIGSEIAARKYGLEILAKEIGNEDNNRTMFIVISREGLRKSGRSRTSLVVVPPVNKPGVLSGILNDFSDENIDLKMIQSRPDGKGNYIFYMDIEGHVEDENVKRVLEKLGEDSGVKVLGSYPYVSLSGL